MIKFRLSFLIILFFPFICLSADVKPKVDAGVGLTRTITNTDILVDAYNIPYVTPSSTNIWTGSNIFNNVVIVLEPTKTNSPPSVNWVIKYVSTNSSSGGGTSWTNVPTATNSIGSPGQMAYTNNYLYICVESNVWKRTILSLW